MEAATKILILKQNDIAAAVTRRATQAVTSAQPVTGEFTWMEAGRYT